MRIALTAGLLCTPLETVADPIVLIEDGRIERVATRAEMELPRNIRLEAFPRAVLAPGLIDLHTHGGAGCDVMSATPDEFTALERFQAAHGVTAYCPTTVTAPLDVTLRALERLADWIESRERGPGSQCGPGSLTRAGRVEDSPEHGLSARPLGIHLEGPFISHEKRGVHPPEHLQAPSVELFDRLYRAARGHVSMLTIAPELPGACELIAEAARRGVCVSLGHSNADYDCACAAVAAGARHATHTFNAMRALDHRAPGLLGTVLGDDRLTADIIADGIHVHPSVVSLFVRAKGQDRAVLITDSISAAGMPDGRYLLGAFEVDVAGGRCLAEGRLAGSVLTLDCAVRNVMAFASWNLASALPLATLNPARVLGLDPRTGVLAAGGDADIVILSTQGEVIKTIIGGFGI